MHLCKGGKNGAESINLTGRKRLDKKSLECNNKREALTSALEETAIKIRTTSDDMETVNDNFVSVTTELEKDECGSLNLSACFSCSCSKSSSKTVQTLQRRITLYRDMAEQLKAKNRRLHLEMHENVEAVRKFWRNSVLEERTRAGNIVMMA